ncbi:putative methylesterase 11, chloroplastic [Sarracenia purpurea var. burkii]
MQNRSSQQIPVESFVSVPSSPPRSLGSCTRKSKQFCFSLSAFSFYISLSVSLLHATITMGLCLSRREAVKKKPSRRISYQLADTDVGASNRWSRTRSTKKEKFEDSMIHEQALAAAILFQQHQQQLQNGGAGGSVQFDRSASLRYPNANSKKQAPLPRSASSRARSLTDPLIQPHQLVNQDVKLDDLETNHFVLVHGGGFGAWCWYKTIALLEEGGYRVTAIDLTGSGIHSFDTNNITNLSQYVKPLTGLIESLADGEKVILVGHDFGGTCISYAMELFPQKVSKAVFIAAAMLTSEQSTLDTLSQKADSNDLMRQAQIFLYANGNTHPPTAIDLDKSLLRDLLFNQSPAKDVALASVSMRPIPFAPVLEKLSLSDKNYGSVRRFYIETLEDNAIPIALQESMINKSPPERVFRLKGADHSPFFSKPQALHKLLVEISKMKSLSQ